MNFPQQPELLHDLIKTRTPQSGELEYACQARGVIGLDDVDQLDQLSVLSGGQCLCLALLGKLAMVFPKFSRQLAVDFSAKLFLVVGEAGERVFDGALTFDHRQKGRTLINSGAGGGLPEP